MTQPSRSYTLERRHPMRIALDIDSTLHDYWDVLSAAARRQIGIDLLIDDSPVNLQRALDTGIRGATILHPWNRDLCETEDVICAPDWPGLEAKLAPVLAG